MAEGGGGRDVLYGVLAKYYDRIYHWKDYEGEAETLRRIISRYKRSTGKSLLDVGCGTGKHIQILRKDFGCVGVDASQQMLREARKNIPGIKLVKGDMRDFRIGSRFDVVVSLFSGIGHLRTYANLRRAMANFVLHMKEGGVLIIEPWITEEVYKSGLVHMQTYDGADAKIVRMSVGGKKRMLSTLRYHYLIGEAGGDIIHMTDYNELAMYDPKEVLRIMRGQGLEARFLRQSLMPGRGLYVGVKRAGRSRAAAVRPPA